MTKILKERVDISQSLFFYIHHYRNFKFLSAQSDIDSISIWFEGEPVEANHTQHIFQLIYTGDYVPDNATYLSTIQFGCNEYVLHFTNFNNMTSFLVYRRPSGSISCIHAGGWTDFPTKQACQDWLETNYPGASVEWQVGPDAKHSQLRGAPSLQTPENPPPNL